MTFSSSNHHNNNTLTTPLRRVVVVSSSSSSNSRMTMTLSDTTLLFLVVLLLLGSCCEAWLTLPTSSSTARMTTKTSTRTTSRTALFYQSNSNITTVEPSTTTDMTSTSSTTTRRTPPPTTLGDIMAKGGMTTESFVSALTGADKHPYHYNSHTTSTTKHTTTLAAAYNFTNPLDRMVLTANGNLQRLLASYYDADVTVVLEHQSRSLLQSNTWHRVVSLQLKLPSDSNNPHTLVRATSDVTIHHPRFLAWVASGKVGLGQLFRYGNILPEFLLHRAGRDDTADTNANNNAALDNDDRAPAFWREYTLESDAVTCHIREEFCAGLWELNVPKGHDNNNDNHHHDNNNEDQE